ncbi:MAG: hypothetical protein CMH54_11560 [Myxococcales bacterium]|nr:hypothetical protein [Myxococcales bacterium]
MHPEPFHLGPLPIAPYGICVATGLIFAVILARRQNEKSLFLDAENFEKVVFWTVVWGFLVSRLLYFWTVRTEEPLLEFVQIWKGGLVFYGGPLGSAAYLLWQFIYSNRPREAAEARRKLITGAGALLVLVSLFLAWGTVEVGADEKTYLGGGLWTGQWGLLFGGLAVLLAMRNIFGAVGLSAIALLFALSVDSAMVTETAKTFPGPDAVAKQSFGLGLYVVGLVLVIAGSLRADLESIRNSLRGMGEQSHQWLMDGRHGFLRFADIVTPSLVLAHAFGRVGCLFAGCCFGRPVSESHSWAIHYPDPGNCAEGSEFLSAGCAQFGRYPVPLIEAALLCLLFWLLINMRPKKKFHGHIFLSYLMVYPLLRFVIEMFRGDKIRGFLVEIQVPGLAEALGFDAAPNEVLMLTTSQFISLLVVGLAVVMRVRMAKKYGSGDTVQSES